MSRWILNSTRTPYMLMGMNELESGLPLIWSACSQAATEGDNRSRLSPNQRHSARLNPIYPLPALLSKPFALPASLRQRENNEVLLNVGGGQSMRA